ncbi:MAG: DUF11 domain-containing protein, partial [Candidatus Bipolaricaulota bacterium]
LLDFVPPELGEDVVVSRDGVSWWPLAGAIEIGELDVAESAVVLLRGTVRLEVGEALTNVVQVDADTPDPEPANNVATVTTPIARSADLAVGKEDGPDPVAAGESVTYTIRVTNLGPQDATDVVVTERLADEVNWISFEPSAGAYDPSAATWEIGALRVGETVSMILVVEVDPSHDGEIRNTVSVESELSDPDPANNEDVAVTTVFGTLGGGGFDLPQDGPCQRVSAVADRLWYVTDEAMVASAELLRSHELITVQPLLSDTLLPTGLRSLFAEGSAIAFDNLLQVAGNPDLGIGLLESPRVRELAAARGVRPEDVLTEILDRYAALAGLAGERPDDEDWTFLEYSEGDPRLLDVGGRLWPAGEWTQVDATIDPSALGQSLTHQVLQARLLGESHDALDRYISWVLTEVAANKLLVLERETELQRLAHGYSVSTDRGDVELLPIGGPATPFDLASLLVGVLEFADFSDPESSSRFGPGRPFDASYHGLATEIASGIVEAIERALGGEAPLAVTDAGLLLVGLARAGQTSGLDAQGVAVTLAGSLSARLVQSQAADGSFGSWLLPAREDAEVHALVTQCAAIYGLAAADRAAGTSLHDTVVEDALRYLETEFLDPTLGIYAAEVRDGRRHYCYTPLDLAVLSGAMRELARSAGPHAELALQRLGSFFDALAKDAGLHLGYARDAGTFGTYLGVGAGEIAGLELLDAPRGVAPVFQSDLCLEGLDARAKCCGVRSEPDPWFETDAAMYAASAIQDGFSRSEDDADSNLTSLIVHSGMGVPARLGPYFRERAAAGGMSIDRYLTERFSDYAQRSGFDLETARAVGRRAVVLPYASGSPRLLHAAGLAWPEETFFARHEGTGIGMTLLRGAQEAGQLLSGARAGGVGGTPEEGFYGLLLLGNALNQLRVIEALLEQTGAETGSAYVPRAFRIVEIDGDLRYEILDASSHVADHAAVLSGLAELAVLFANPSVEELLTAGEPFSDLSVERVSAAARSIVLHLHATHYDGDQAAFVDRATWGPDGWSRDDRVTTTVLALLAAGLDAGSGIPSDSEETATLSAEILRQSLDFLLSQEGSSGGLFPSACDGGSVATVGRSVGLEGTIVTAQLAVIDALTIGALRFGDDRYLDAAVRAFATLEGEVLVPVERLAACGTERHLSCPSTAERFCFTPWDVGFAVRGLNALAANSDAVAAAEILRWLEQFYDQAAIGSGLLLPSGAWGSAILEGTDGTAPRFAPVFVRGSCTRRPPTEE